MRFALFASGEHSGKFVRRIIAAVEEIIKQHEGERVLIVTHWGVLGILTRFFNDESMKNWEEVGPWAACGITEFRSNGRDLETVRMNADSHL